MRVSPWEEATNESGEPIPSNAVVRIASAEDGVPGVTLPDEDNDTSVAVAGNHVIEEDGTGQITYADRVIVAYDEDDGTPAVGEEWGVAAGSWKIRSGKRGFFILGGAGAGRVNALRVGIRLEASSGSGSGSGDGCADAVSPVTFDTSTNGRLEITTRSVGVTTDGSTIGLTECETDSVVITGPRSPVTPEGTKTAVLTTVCPITTTLDQATLQAILDGDLSIDVVIGIKARRKVIVPAIVDDAVGCLETTEADCCESGSGGNPAKCVAGINGVHTCPNGTPTQLDLILNNGATVATLYYQFDANSGSTSSYLSADGQWELDFLEDYLTFVLTDTVSGEQFVAPAGIWDCNGENFFTPVSPDDFSHYYNTAPVFECANNGYDCVADWGCLGMPASLAEYATLAECEDVCTEIPPDGKRYSCIAGHCAPDPDGPFTSLLACALSCNPGSGSGSGGGGEGESCICCPADVDDALVIMSGDCPDIPDPTGIPRLPLTAGFQTSSFQAFGGTGDAHLGCDGNQSPVVWEFNVSVGFYAGSTGPMAQDGNVLTGSITFSPGGAIPDCTVDVTIILPDGCFEECS